MKRTSKTTELTIEPSAWTSSYTKGVPVSLYPMGENLRIRASAPFFEFTRDGFVTEALSVSRWGAPGTAHVRTRRPAHVFFSDTSIFLSPRYTLRPPDRCRQDSVRRSGRKVPFVCNEPGWTGVLPFQAVLRRYSTATVDGLLVRTAWAKNCLSAGRIGSPGATDRPREGVPDPRENRRNRPPGRRGFTSLVRRQTCL